MHAHFDKSEGELITTTQAKLLRVGQQIFIRGHKVRVWKATTTGKQTEVLAKDGDKQLRFVVDSESFYPNIAVRRKGVF